MQNGYLRTSETAKIMGELSRCSHILEKVSQFLQVRAVPHEQAIQARHLGLVQRVAEVFEVGPGTLTGRLRTGKATLARQACFYIMREHIKMTYEDIGRAFCRHHCTVVYGVRAAKDNMDTLPDYKAKIQTVLADVVACKIVK